MEGFDKERERQAEIRRKQRIAEKEAATRQQQELERQRWKEKAELESAIHKAEVLNAQTGGQSTASSASSSQAVKSKPAIRLSASSMASDNESARLAALERLARRSKPAEAQEETSRYPPPPPVSQRKASIAPVVIKPPRIEKTKLKQSTGFVGPKPSTMIERAKPTESKSDSSKRIVKSSDTSPISTSGQPISPDQASTDKKHDRDDNLETNSNSIEPSPEQEPLSPEWMMHFDSNSQNYYYFCSTTGISTWDRPGIDRDASLLSSREDTIFTPAAALPEDWVMVLDAQSGYYYYYNRLTLETCWDRPSPAQVSSRSPEVEGIVAHVETKLKLLEDLQAQILLASAALQKQEATVVDPAYTISTEELIQKQKVKNHPLLEEYRIVFEQTFNEAFIAAAMMHSGEFQMEDGSPTSGAEAELMDAVSFLTVVSANLPIVSNVLSLAGSALGEINAAKKRGKFTRLSNLNSTSSTLVANRISNRIAVGCALRYEDLIVNLEAKGSKETSKDIVERVQKFARKRLSKIGGENLALGMFGDSEVSAVTSLALEHAQTALTFIMSDRGPTDGLQEKDAIELIIGSIELNLNSALPQSKSRTSEIDSVRVPEVYNPQNNSTPNSSKGSQRIGNPSPPTGCCVVC